ncbi:MAG: hypothetical protein PHP45_05985 [Elusimicrobiales bacterium]|nr:hypothetical protein [Elusimicrobiales bacterium]
MKKTILTLALALAAAPAVFAARLDFNADVSLKTAAWSNLDFATSNPSNRIYFEQAASLGFLVKDLRYIPGGEEAMDVGITLGALGLNAQGGILPPFDAIANFYPNSNMTPWVKEAYFRLHGLLGGDITLTAGRQSFTLATGLTLSDNGLGMPGFNIRYNKALFHSLNVQGFVFQPKAPDSTGGAANVAGILADYAAQGLWQFYSFCEFDHQTTQVISIPVKHAFRNFSGVSYSLRYGSLSFDAEAALEKGSAAGDNGNSDVSFNGNALLLRGKWSQPLGRFGTGTARVAAGRASGDNASTTGTDEAFFPSFGKRYEGLERAGFGAVFGSSLYDAFGGDSSTKTGMPAGFSGIQMVNLGLSFSPYRSFMLDADFFVFAADSAPTTQKQLGSELDLKLSCPLSDQVSINMVYGVFSPGAAYSANLDSPSKFAFETSARF